MTYKEKFPDENSLQVYIGQNSNLYFKKVKAEIGHLETAYKKGLRQKIFGLSLIIGAIILPVIIPLVNNFIFPLLGMGILIYFGYKNIRTSHQTITTFNIRLNKTLFPLIFSIFGLNGQKIQQEKSEVLNVLDHSELITESRNRVTVDDLFVASFADSLLSLSELDVKHVRRSGKRRHVKHIFKGIFVSFDLQKVLNGKTFISTEGDTVGMGHRSFLNYLSSHGVQTTKLEWNDFEKLLHVATTDPVEARYILPPDFMEDMYQWWQHKKQNIRISFIEQKMYILFPDKKTRFGSTIKNVSEREIVTYIESIATPLLHVLHLIEDVNHQFNKKV